MDNQKQQAIYEVTQQRLIPRLLEVMNDEVTQEFMEMKRKDVINFHFGFGLWIRNNMLYNDDELFDTFMAAGYMDADDMSMYILEQLYDYLHAADKNNA